MLPKEPLGGADHFGHPMGKKTFDTLRDFLGGGLSIGLGARRLRDQQKKKNIIEVSGLRNPEKDVRGDV